MKAGAGLGSSEEKEVQWLAFSAQAFEGSQSPGKQTWLGLELSLEQAAGSLPGRGSSREGDHVTSSVFRETSPVPCLC